MANQIDGGTEARAVVSGLDQEELTLQEQMATKSPKLAPHGSDKADEPGETPVGTGEADDAFGTLAGQSAQS